MAHDAAHVGAAGSADAAFHRQVLDGARIDLAEEAHAILTALFDLQAGNGVVLTVKRALKPSGLCAVNADRRPLLVIQVDVVGQRHGLAREVVARIDLLGEVEQALGGGDGHVAVLVLHIAVSAYLHAEGAVRVLGGDVAVSAQGLVHRAGERTAGDGNLVVLREIARGQVLPVVGLDRGVAALGRELTALDLNLVQALVAGALHDGDGRAVLDGAVVLGLGNAVTGDGDGRVSAADVQAAGADLHAHGLGVDDAVVDGQRAGAGEVDAEAVGHVQRTVPQRHGIVGVAAVGLDAAVAVGRHLDALEHQSGIVILDGAAHGGGDQTRQLAANHLAVLHGQRHIGIVDLEGRGRRVHDVSGPRMPAQIDGEALITGVLHLVRGVVSQHDDGLARLDSVERLIHGVVLGVADLGQIRLRHTEGAVVVLSNGGILHHVLGGVFGERAAGDLDGGLGCLVHSNQAIVIGIGAQRTGDGAAGHIDPRLLVRSIVIVHGSNIAVDRAAADFQLAERRTGAVYPGGHGAVDRTALDIGVVPVLNGEAVGGVHGAAQQVQCTAIHLDGDEVILGKRTTLDGQGGPSTDAVVAQTDQGGTLDAGDAAVVLHLAALDDHKAVLALDVDDIVGSLRVRSILTLDGTSLRLAAVFQRDLLVVDGQRGLGILGAAIQRMTIQVKDDGILGNRDILASIRQQGYGRAALGRVNSRLQGLVLGTVDLCHGGFHRFLDLVKGRDCAVISLRLHRDRFAGGLSDLSSFHLIQRGAGGAIGLKAGHHVRAAQRHIKGLRAVLDVQERLARLVGVDCAAVYFDSARVRAGLLHVDIDALTGDVEPAAFKGHGLGGIIPQSIVALRCIEGRVHKLRGLIAPIRRLAFERAVLNHGVADTDEAAIIRAVAL